MDDGSDVHYYGATFDKGNRKWRAQSSQGELKELVARYGRMLYIGLFATKEEAAHEVDVYMISKELGEDPPEDYNLPDQMVPELIAELDKKTLDDVIKEWREAGDSFSTGKSAYRGVSTKKTNSWRAQAHLNGKQTELLSLPMNSENEKLCAQAYDRLQYLNYGSKARFNFGPQHYINDCDPDVASICRALVAVQKGQRTGPIPGISVPRLPLNAAPAAPPPQPGAPAAAPVPIPAPLAPAPIAAPGSTSPHIPPPATAPAPIPQLQEEELEVEVAGLEVGAGLAHQKPQAQQQQDEEEEEEDDDDEDYELEDGEWSIKEIKEAFAKGLHKRLIPCPPRGKYATGLLFWADQKHILPPEWTEEEFDQAVLAEMEYMRTHYDISTDPTTLGELHEGAEQEQGNDDDYDADDEDMEDSSDDDDTRKKALDFDSDDVDSTMWDWNDIDPNLLHFDGIWHPDFYRMLVDKGVINPADFAHQDPENSLKNFCDGLLRAGGIDPDNIPPELYEVEAPFTKEEIQDVLIETIGKRYRAMLAEVYKQEVKEREEMETSDGMPNIDAARAVYEAELPHAHERMANLAHDPAKHDHYVHCINTLHRQLGEPSLHLLGQDVEPNPQAISAEEYQQRMDAAIDAFDVKAEEAAAEGRDMTGKEIGALMTPEFMTHLKESRERAEQYDTSELAPYEELPERYAKMRIWMDEFNKLIDKINRDHDDWLFANKCCWWNNLVGYALRLREIDNSPVGCRGWLVQTLGEDWQTVVAAHPDGKIYGLHRHPPTMRDPYVQLGCYNTEDGESVEVKVDRITKMLLTSPGGGETFQKIFLYHWPRDAMNYYLHQQRQEKLDKERQKTHTWISPGCWEVNEPDLEEAAAVFAAAKKKGAIELLPGGGHRIIPTPDPSDDEIDQDQVGQGGQAGNEEAGPSCSHR